MDWFPYDNDLRHKRVVSQQDPYFLVGKNNSRTNKIQPNQNE